MTGEKFLNDSELAAEIINAPAQDWLLDQYLPFSLYTIRSRALVSDDGLKPVNRRILYTMFKNGLTDDSTHRKAARVVGDTMGLHPHGDSSIDEALGRMAQWHALRVPLVDPQGNVGFTTGDSPAAARYWECRLTPAGMELLNDLNEGALPMGVNYDGTIPEPAELPVRWPNNIINGTEGIAVGYASRIFSHNPDEVMKAVIAVVNNPDLSVEQLMKIMPGPDLATGGELIGVDGIQEYYETGKGTITIRGRYTIEQLSRGKVKIIFYELPYQVSAKKVMIAIKAAQDKGQLGDIAKVQDLTDRKNGLRLVIETKAGTNHINVLNELFKSTPVQARMAANNTVLVGGKAVRSSMIDILKRFVEFRRLCVLNKAKATGVKMTSRMEQLDALMAILVDIDKCLSIIRNSDTVDDARSGLMSAFPLNNTQADYILSMPLRRITKSDRIAIEKEREKLLADKAVADSIVSDPDVLDEKVIDEIKRAAKVISSPRRTVISGLTMEEAKEEAKIHAQAARDANKNLPCYVVRFANGTVLRTDKPYGYDFTARRFDNSPVVEQFKAKTQENILIIGSDGIARRAPLSYMLPDTATAVDGLGVKLPAGVTIIGLAKDTVVKGDIGLALGSEQGEAKLVKPEWPNKDEFVVMALKDGDKVIGSRWVSGKNPEALYVSVSASGNILAYAGDSLRASGHQAGGVRSQKLGDDDRVVHFDYLATPADDTMIFSQSHTTMKTTLFSEIPPKGRGAQGVALHRPRKGEGTLTKAFVGRDIAVGISDMNNAVMLPTVTRRATAGVEFAMMTDVGTRGEIVE